MRVPALCRTPVVTVSHTLAILFCCRSLSRNFRDASLLLDVLSFAVLRSRSKQSIGPRVGSAFLGPVGGPSDAEPIPLTYEVVLPG